MILAYDGIIYASVLAVLCIGLTLTYKVTRVANFAHMSFAILGMYMALTISQVAGFSIYMALPVAFAVSGLVSLLLYYGVIRIMQKKKSTTLSIIIATLSFDIFMIGVLNIIADVIRSSFHVISRDFTLRSMDVVLLDGTLPMVLVASITIIAGLVIGLYFLLYRTKYGMQMRGSIENQALAETLGINTKKIFCMSWFLSGGLAGMAGVLMALWFQGDPALAALMIPSIFAGSIVGGFTSIYGAILGGFLVGLFEIVGTGVLADIFGYWIAQYRQIIPFAVMIVTLMILPNGLATLVSKWWAKR